MPKTDAEKLQRRNQELSILNSIAQALNREVDLRRALESALAQVAELLDLRTGWVWLLREDNGEPYLAAAQNLPPALARNPARMEGSCYCLDTFRAGDLSGAANVNVITCSRLRGLVGDTAGLRYHASIPLYAQGKKLGVLNVASADWRELVADDLRLLYTVGDVLSMAIERARLFEQSAAFWRSGGTQPACTRNPRHTCSGPDRDHPAARDCRRAARRKSCRPAVTAGCTTGPRAGPGEPGRGPAFHAGFARCASARTHAGGSPGRAGHRIAARAAWP